MFVLLLEKNKRSCLDRIRIVLYIPKICQSYILIEESINIYIYFILQVVKTNVCRITASESYCSECLFDQGYKHFDSPWVSPSSRIYVMFIQMFDYRQRLHSLSDKDGVRVWYMHLDHVSVCFIWHWLIYWRIDCNIDSISNWNSKEFHSGMIFSLPRR